MVKNHQPITIDKSNNSSFVADYSHHHPLQPYMSPMRMFCFAVLILFATVGNSQENNYYLIEFEKFSPPVKDIINSFEERAAPPFMASDISGNKRTLDDFKGKKVLIWFWSVKDGLSIDQITYLNEIQSSFKDELQIVSFGMEEKEELTAFRTNNPINFPIIPQSKIFGDLAYGGDLGLGRIFLIDDNGVVQKVFPRTAFENNSEEAFKFVKDMIGSI